MFVFLGPTRWTGVRSVTRLAGWIRARIVGPLNTLGGTNGRPRERGCKTDDNCFLLIDEFQSGPCALTRLTVSLHAYTSNCRATSRGERTRCCTASCLQARKRDVSARSYDSITPAVYPCATSLPADVRPESVMSATPPVSVLISDRMDRKEERKGLPSGSIRRSFFGRRAASCII